MKVLNEGPISDLMTYVKVSSNDIVNTCNVS